jgi:hypothetical protein
MVYCEGRLLRYAALCDVTHFVRVVTIRFPEI